MGKCERVVPYSPCPSLHLVHTAQDRVSLHARSCAYVFPWPRLCTPPRTLPKSPPGLLHGPSNVRH